MGNTAFQTLYTELSARLNDPPNTVWTLTQIKRYVNGAIAYWDMLGGYTPATDQATILPVSNQLSYNLPAAITNPRQILRILKRTSISKDFSTTDMSASYSAFASTPISEPYFDFEDGLIVFNGTQGKLLLSDFLMTYDVIVVMYKTNHASLVNDADTTDIPPEAIYAYGRYLAHNEMAGKVSENDRKYHIEEREAALRDANQIIPMAIRQYAPDMVLKQNGAILSRW